MGPLIVVLVLVLVVLIVVSKTAIVVPQQSAFVVERLGRYSDTLQAGFHILLPFVDMIRYRHSLKEEAMDIPAQVCITRDNVQVGVDGVLYLKVLNPERASYGIADYIFAISQLAQTTLRSEIGKIDLDKTFEERMNINTQVVSELDKASEPWGVKVLRYEIKNITPPHDVLAAMEKQMRAEREKRAVILTSEGARDAAINNAEGEKQQVIKASEARQAAADQRGRRPGVSDSRRGDRDGRGHPSGRRSDQGARRLRGDAAPRRRAVHLAVRSDRAGQRLDARSTNQPDRRWLDDHLGHADDPAQCRRSRWSRDPLTDRFGRRCRTTGCSGHDVRNSARVISGGRRVMPSSERPTVRSEPKGHRTHPAHTPAKPLTTLAVRTAGRCPATRRSDAAERR